MKNYFLCLVLVALLLPAQAQVAYLLTANTISDYPEEIYKGMKQQPERNAATWFDNQFVKTGQGAFLHPNELATKLDTAAYKVLWVHVDRVGLTSLSATGIDDAAIAAIKTYLQKGGNVYLSKQACHLAYAINRMGYTPSWSNGGYSNGGDVWTINPHLGIWPEISQQFDRSTHKVYNGLQTLSNNNWYTYQDQNFYYITYPLVGAVARTDNNNMWTDMFRKDPVTGGKMEEQAGYTHYSNTDPLRLKDFEQDWQCKVLSVWGQVVDFCAPGLIEFLPTSSYKGRMITNGFAAYQWGTDNNYLTNIQRLTSNIIAYLLNPDEEEPTPPTPPEPVTKDAIVYMPMEITGSSTTETVSNQSVNIPSVATSPICVPGVIGNAWRTDGYSSYITLSLNPTQESRMAGNALTISIWCAAQTYPMMNVNEAQNVMSSIVGNLSDGRRTGWAFRLSSQGDLQFECYAGGNKVTILSPKKMPCGVWNNLVVTLDVAQRKASFYCNGQLLGQTNLFGALNLGNEMIRIGKPIESLTAFNCNINTFNGLLDEFRIDGYVWTPTDITTYSQEMGGKRADLSVPRSYFESNILRPQFHGMPSANWTNESHGMVYYNGRYHVFFQKNGNGPYMARLHWGHISSENLAEWREEPIALYPDKNYDIKGCWSGAILQDNIITNNVPWLMYTGVDNGHASINFAQPVGDDYTTFSKSINPRIASCPGGYDSDFRDPYFFRKGNDGYVTVGTGKNGVGTTALFKWNGLGWNHIGEFFTGNNAGECGTFFEMANITPMGDKWLFTATPFGGSQGVRTIYWVGTINDQARFVPNQTSPRTVELIGLARDGFGLLSPTICQHDGKTIALGIVPDILPTEDNRRMGWAHCYSLPREWSITDSGELHQKAYSGLQALRSKTHQYIEENTQVNGQKSLDAVAGRELELRAEFTVTYSATGFSLLRNAQGKGVKIYFDPMTQQLVVDMREVARIVNDNGSFKGLYSSSLPNIIRPGEKMTLHVFLDRSVLDIFINDKWASSIRIFPTDVNAMGAAFFTEETTSVTRLEAYRVEVGTSPHTDIEQVEFLKNAPMPKKILHNGQFYILNNDKVYSILGAEL